MAPLVTSLNTTAAINDICFTDSCIKTASSLLHSIDMNVDPCSDFYQYTCKKAPIADIILLYFFD